MCGILYVTKYAPADKSVVENDVSSLLKLGLTGLVMINNRGKDGGCGIVFYTPYQAWKLHPERSAYDEGEKKFEEVSNFSKRVRRGYDNTPANVRMIPEAVLGHVRYSTQGEVNLANVHPLMAHYPKSKDLSEEIKTGPHGVTLAMVVNGETWIQPEWEERIKDVDIKGATSDSAKLAGMIVHDYVQTSNLEKVLYDVYNEIFDYGMIAAAGILVDDRINKQYLFKIIDGGRPFCEAKVDGHLVGVSETNYLQALKLKKQNTVDYINQIGGGTITIQDLQTKKITTSPRMDRIKPKCFFDKHYLQRPDSIWGKRTNASYRRWCGRCLASEHPPLRGKDVAVTAVPQSGISYTHGFCHKSRAMQEEILIRSPLSKDDRSFMISQNKKDRGELALWKLDVSEQDCVGKIVVAVDDSLVEGNMFVKAVFLLRNAGAAEVHFRVGCPPIVGPCHSGIYIPAERPLVKQLGLDPKEIVKDQSLLEERLKHISDPEFGELNVDSVGYLSIESLKKCLGKKRYCMGCVTLEYPYKFNGMEKCDAKFVPVKPRKKTEEKSIPKGQN